MRGKYERHGPTGFLHAVHQWRVECGGRIVHRGRNARDARREFARYCKLSSDSIGRASGQAVFLEKDGRVMDQFPRAITGEEK